VDLMPFPEGGLGVTARGDGDDHGEHRDDNRDNAEGVVQAKRDTNDRSHRTNSLRERVHAAA